MTDGTFGWMLLIIIVAFMARCAANCKNSVQCADELCPPGTAPLFLSADSECVCMVRP